MVGVGLGLADVAVLLDELGALDVLGLEVALLDVGTLLLAGADELLVGVLLVADAAGEDVVGAGLGFFFHDSVSVGRPFTAVEALNAAVVLLVVPTASEYMPFPAIVCETSKVL